MKKRGQHPNAQTYTILFNGFAHSSHPKLAVGEAFKHYNLLLQDPRLQPNATHMNALLFVCSKAGDIDSMFHIISTANDKARSPNAFTYTIILNALRHHALAGADDLAPAQKTANITTAVGRAKAIWSEVISGWTNGKTQIDEALVCAMGRILLQSPDKRDKLSVLDLVQQTMNVPNFTAKADKTDLVRRFEPVKRKTLDDTALQSFEKPSAATAAVTRAASHKGLYAVPTQNTLSLILKTAATLNLTTAGLSYWHHIVDTLSVAADTDCYLRLLGMLKVGRASSHAASFMPIIPRADLNPRMYKIAMEACIRDNINDHVVPNARSILTSMLERLPTPDIHTLRLYLHTALVSHARFRTKAAKGTDLKDEAKRDYALQITAAIDDLWEPYRALYNKYFKALPSAAAVPGKILYNEQREVIALARAMFSAYNKVVSENMLSAEELAPLKPVGARINREIQAFYSIPDENTGAELPSFEAGRGKRGDKNKDKSKTTPLILHQGGDFIWDTGKSTLQPENYKEPSQGRHHSRRTEGIRDDESDIGHRHEYRGRHVDRGSRRQEHRPDRCDSRHLGQQQHDSQRFSDRRPRQGSYRNQRDDQNYSP